VSGMQRVKPFEVEGDILLEMYFAQFFPVQELVAEKIMTRTRYGVTLTKQFKDEITQRMRELGMGEKTISNFEDRRYLDVQLRELWTPIVFTVCKHCGYSCQVIRGQVYVDEKHVEQARMKGSAVYVWFRHVQNALRKEEVAGEYV